MDPLKFACTCQNAASKWIEMPPESPHRYRVECGACGKFIKWGVVSELHDRSQLHERITTEPYYPEDHPPPANLGKFFT